MALRHRDIVSLHLEDAVRWLRQTFRLGSLGSRRPRAALWFRCVAYTPALQKRRVRPVFFIQSDSRQGFLGSDPTGHQGASTEESLLVIPSKRLPGAAGLEYPANYQSRCLFRIEVGRGYSSSAGDDIVYGQAIMLVHVNTGMHLTAITQETVRLQPSLGSGAYFLVEPRYKLRSEGEKVLALDHVVLQSRRFAGAFLHLRKPSIDGGDGPAAAEVREVRPLENLLERGRSLLEAAGGGGAEAGAQPQGAEHAAELEVDLALTRTRTLTPNPEP